MALIVEDGTGLEAADSYASLAEFKAYADARGIDYSSFTDPDLEEKIRDAFGYVNTHWRYKGIRMTRDQSGEFPRTDLVDFDGYTIEGVPARVKNAQHELTVRAFTNTLEADLARGGMVKSEQIGPISRTFMDGAPSGKTWTAAENYLKPYIYTKNTEYAGPHFDTLSDADRARNFSVGMMDNDAPLTEEVDS